jgi:hypothetical protein
MNNTLTRRSLLHSMSGGLGALALAVLDYEQANADGLDPLAPKRPHFAPKAKSVIWCFMEGGPSHIDLFDPKPQLARLAGQPLPKSFGRPLTAMGTAENGLMPSRRTFQQHGRSGLWVSDWYPHIARHADDLCVVRSCWADGLNHVGSVCQMNTGSILAGRPSMGAWVQYGLGSANRDLPAYVVLLDEKEPLGGTKNWSSGFLPATYAGTQFNADGPPIYNLTNAPGIDEGQQRARVEFLQNLNRLHHASRRESTDLEARIRSYELAFRMQAAAPEAVDLRKETAATRALYGIGSPLTDRFGTNCLLARRLVERGVRFVQLYCGTGSQWDAHADLEGNHAKMCAVSDRPVAGLIADLKSRGMLDTTLVVWGGEFGRTPMSEGAKGRDHNPWGFTIFFAGGGTKGGCVVGSTDELGLRAVQDPVHVHDIHATILHLMGMDHLRLTARHDGRNERPTVNGGRVVHKALA